MELLVPMERLTTFRVGGKADLVVYPLDAEDLKAVLQVAASEEVPLFILGLGSNLLVRDEGIRGIVVNLKEGFREIARDGETGMVCGAGAPLSEALSRSAGFGLAGLEFLSGVPGTVGGAVRMNAGAFGREMKDIVREVTFMDRKGEIQVKSRDELPFSYRDLPLSQGEVILGCRIALEPGERNEIRERIRANAMRRVETQPYDRPTAGSVFKNPPGEFAGRLIDEAGLRGVQVGGARISNKHANFIENVGGASSDDVIALMERMKKAVFEKKGIVLEPEIKIVGDEKLRAAGGGR